MIERSSSVLLPFCGQTPSAGKFIIFFEYFLLMYKRKAHEPFPLDTRPLCRNTNLLSLKKQLGTCARKLAFAQTVRACADCFAIRSRALPVSLSRCGAACESRYADLCLRSFFDSMTITEVTA